MTDQNMIEKVARALCMENGGFPDAKVGASHKEWMFHIKAARAAIETMREPTEAMLMAGNDSFPDEGEHTCSAVSKMVWQAMIDAALSADV